MNGTLSQLKGFFTAAVIMTAISSPVFSAGPSVSIARYYGNATGALSFTFDDGSQNQVDIAMPMLEEFGFRGTFFVIVGPTRDNKADPPLPGANTADNWCNVSWEEWRAGADRGHEIACHSMTHVDLTGLDAQRLYEEVAGAKELMAAKMGEAPRTFAYPYNGVNDNVRTLVYEHFLGAREYQDAYGMGMINNEAGMNAVADKAVSNGSWEVAMLHGIAQAWGAVDTAAFRGHLAWCRALSDSGKLWVAPFVSVLRYVKERDSTSVKIVEQEQGRIAFTTESNLDLSRYSHPLTFIIGPVETEPEAMRAYIGSTELSARYDGGKILVDASAAADTITVEWGDEVGLAENAHGSARKIKRPSGI
jgi:peptidoglycan/xylan/chitin deacetylase (PgdA/CDA1 family)